MIDQLNKNTQPAPQTSSHSVTERDFLTPTALTQERISAHNNDTASGRISNLEVIHAFKAMKAPSSRTLGTDALSENFYTHASTIQARKKSRSGPRIKLLDSFPQTPYRQQLRKGTVHWQLVKSRAGREQLWNERFKTGGSEKWHALSQPEQEKLKEAYLSGTGRCSIHRFFENSTLIPPEAQGLLIDVGRNASLVVTNPCIFLEMDVPYTDVPLRQEIKSANKKSFAAEFLRGTPK